MVFFKVLSRNIFPLWRLTGIKFITGMKFMINMTISISVFKSFFNSLSPSPPFQTLRCFTEEWNVGKGLFLLSQHNQRLTGLRPFPKTIHAMEENWGLMPGLSQPWFLVHLHICPQSPFQGSESKSNTGHKFVKNLLKILVQSEC